MEEFVVHGKGGDGGEGRQEEIAQVFSGHRGEGGSSSDGSFCSSDCSLLCLLCLSHLIAGDSFTPERQEEVREAECEPCCGFLPPTSTAGLSVLGASPRQDSARGTALGEAAAGLPLGRAKGDFIPGTPSPHPHLLLHLTASFLNVMKFCFNCSVCKDIPRSLFPKTILSGITGLDLSGCTPPQMLSCTCGFVST